jgi:hypothetical protein
LLSTGLIASEDSMKVICSWCKEEGRPELVREKAPLADARETHGICDVHLQQMGVCHDTLVSSHCDSTLPRHKAVLLRRMRTAAVTY